MIATTTGFWKAFFDPDDARHGKSKSEALVFDREKILISQFVIAEVVGWLAGIGKEKQKIWFLDYAQNTANTRIFHFGKEEFAEISRISADEGISIADASVEHLKRGSDCDVTGY
jgi:predicted nucleic acid-binding protein